MEDLSAIINTDILPGNQDDFWNDPPLKLAPLDVLIIAQPVDAASTPQLQKMLSACGLSLDSCNLVEFNPEEKIAWHKLREITHPKYVIVLGIEPMQLGLSIHFMPHQVNRFDGCSWIPTFSIPQLEANPEIKKHLWQYGLKPVFIEKAYG